MYPVDLLHPGDLGRLSPLPRHDRVSADGPLRYPPGCRRAGEFVLHFGDRVFLRGAVSLADLGLYGLAYKLGMVVLYLSTPFFTYWNAQMVGIVRRPAGSTSMPGWPPTCCCCCPASWSC